VKPTDLQIIECVREFIKLNTPVTSIRFWQLNVDFSQELKFNHNILHCDGEFLWMRHYLERNIKLSEMTKHFKMKPISKVNSFNLNFKFE
jgi:hypothetical protein